MPQSTQDTARYILDFDYRAITFYSAAFQGLRLSRISPRCSPTTPMMFPPLVWPTPRSLATTRGIFFNFYSSRYLDVSVPWVRFLDLWIQSRITVITAGLPHSETRGSVLIYQLPAAYRRLSRPSSPLSTKASIVCS